MHGMYLCLICILTGHCRFLLKIGACMSGDSLTHFCCFQAPHMKKLQNGKMLVYMAANVNAKQSRHAFL